MFGKLPHEQNKMERNEMSHIWVRVLTELLLLRLNLDASLKRMLLVYILTFEISSPLRTITYLYR